MGYEIVLDWHFVKQNSTKIKNFVAKSCKTKKNFSTLQRNKEIDIKFTINLILTKHFFCL